MIVDRHGEDEDDEDDEGHHARGYKQARRQFQKMKEHSANRSKSWISARIPGK